MSSDLGQEKGEIDGCKVAGRWRWGANKRGIFRCREKGERNPGLSLSNEKHVSGKWRRGEKEPGAEAATDNRPQSLESVSGNYTSASELIMAVNL